MLCLLFLTDFLYYLPRSVLAAMIMVPVFGLLDLRAFRRLFSISRDEGAIATITFVVTLLSAPRLHWGVFVGVGLTMVSFLYRRAHPRIAEVGQHQDGTLRDRHRFNLPRLAPDVLAVRLDSALNFLTAAMLERYIFERVRADPEIRRVLLCAGSINDIDVSGIETLDALHKTLQDKAVVLYVSAFKKQVWDALHRAGMVELLRPDNIFSTDSQAIETISTRSGTVIEESPILTATGNRN